MTIREKIKSLRPKSVITITEAELEELKSVSELVEEKDTLMCGFIRILVCEGNVIIQEQTEKNEFIVRLAGSIEEAKKFVQTRIEQYERTWDGCGCKIDYFH